MSSNNSNNTNHTLIKITNFKWKNQVILVSGYYEFEITITTFNSTTTLFKENKIYRRFSDIEILSELLKVKHPGCLIPSLPQKSIWTNVYFSNNQKQTEERIQQLNEFFSYISNHNVLSKSQMFHQFLSPEFEQTKEQLLLKNKIDFTNTKDFYYDIFENDNNYKHFYSVYKALKKINVIIINIYQANDKKLQHIQDLINVNDNTNKNNNSTSNIKSNSLDVFKKLTSVITVFTNRMKSFHENSFNKHFQLIHNYLEIYQRKYYFYINKQSTDNLVNDLNDEITIYKDKKKEQLINIISTFFEYKKQYQKDIQLCFDNSNPNIMSCLPSSNINANNNKTTYNGEYIDNFIDDF